MSKGINCCEKCQPIWPDYPNCRNISCDCHIVLAKISSSPIEEKMELLEKTYAKIIRDFNDEVDNCGEVGEINFEEILEKNIKPLLLFTAKEAREDEQKFTEQWIREIFATGEWDGIDEIIASYQSHITNKKK